MNHDLSTLLQVMITNKKVNIDMCPILNGYGVLGVFCRKRFPVKPASQVTLHNLQSAGRRTVSESCNSQTRNSRCTQWSGNVFCGGGGICDNLLNTQVSAK